jgi:putative phosphoribosyl transferase
MRRILFRDRADAGRLLATRLSAYANRQDVLVLGLPRGGVPAAYEAAQALHTPLDVFVVRKLGVPGQEELAMGAVATGGVVLLNPEVVRYLEIGDTELRAVIESEQREVDRRNRLYRGDRPPPALKGRTVILVDDGLATGASMRAACEAVRHLGPARLVVAVPVAPAEACAELRAVADEVVCALTPEPFYGVGMWYEDFTQTSDAQVRDLMARAAEPAPMEAPKTAAA